MAELHNSDQIMPGFIIKERTSTYLIRREIEGKLLTMQYKNLDWQKRPFKDTEGRGTRQIIKIKGIIFMERENIKYMGIILDNGHQYEMYLKIMDR